MGITLESSSPFSWPCRTARPNKYVAFKCPGKPLGLTDLASAFAHKHHIGKNNYFQLFKKQINQSEGALVKQDLDSQ